MFMWRDKVIKKKQIFEMNLSKQRGNEALPRYIYIYVYNVLTLYLRGWLPFVPLGRSHDSRISAPGFNLFRFYLLIG
jgi:hypothetical protein